MPLLIESSGNPGQQGIPSSISRLFPSPGEIPKKPPPQIPQELTGTSAPSPRGLKQAPYRRLTLARLMTGIYPLPPLVA